MTRIDAELVRRGLARSRAQAGELIRSGRVQLGDRPVGKASQLVADGADIHVETAPHDDDVGRGAGKLRGALADLDPGPLRGGRLDGRRCLDVGAGTGGFTQVLLDYGAAEVIALDVGHDQLAPRLARDPRVLERSGVNIRDVTVDDLGGPVDLLVADLSFISLRLVLGTLAALVHDDGDLLLLVKPQFEVGRRQLGSGGVVRSDAAREHTIDAVTQAAGEAGLRVLASVTSQVVGTHGNREAFLWAKPVAERS